MIRVGRVDRRCLSEQCHTFEHIFSSEQPLVAILELDFHQSHAVLVRGNGAQNPMCITGFDHPSNEEAATLAPVPHQFSAHSKRQCSGRASCPGSSHGSCQGCHAPAPLATEHEQEGAGTQCPRPGLGRSTKPRTHLQDCAGRRIRHQQTALIYSYIELRTSPNVPPQCLKFRGGPIGWHAAQANRWFWNMRRCPPGHSAVDSAAHWPRSP
mmetsp:Transcript_68298/g.189701  ORF Transcript_68298/g.189701 Transcript_68298/m.189701 type:complete len:211 (+) Transcript_68298:392-1024(+)